MREFSISDREDLGETEKEDKWIFMPSNSSWHAAKNHKLNSTRFCHFILMKEFLAICLTNTHMT